VHRTMSRIILPHLERPGRINNDDPIRPTVPNAIACGFVNRRDCIFMALDVLATISILAMIAAAVLFFAGMIYSDMIYISAWLLPLGLTGWLYSATH